MLVMQGRGQLTKAGFAGPSRRSGTVIECVRQERDVTRLTRLRR